MTRRMVLLSSLAPLLRADSAQQVWDLFGSMAGALSAANPQIFLSAFDKAMPGYNQLSVDVTALLNEFEVQSSVDFNKNDGDDQKRTVEADWLMILRPVENTNFKMPNVEVLATVQREQVLKCTVVKQGRKWKIVALEPLTFFAPPPA
ncbi:MAG TPA: hypothetical protein VME43_11530 [Bryobacteraceae bacterium]|nr:hypothetical protein [Bryobacteraceae bacterium]